MKRYSTGSTAQKYGTHVDLNFTENVLTPPSGASTTRNKSRIGLGSAKAASQSRVVVAVGSKRIVLKLVSIQLQYASCRSRKSGVVEDEDPGSRQTAPLL